MYVQRQDFNLLTSLENKIEITIIIDGFDELDRNSSQTLILRLEELAENWSHIRVLATGRPIELQEINYSNWQCLELTAISDEEQELLLYNEAISTGMDEEVARKDSNDRFKLLKENNELLTIATSPLVVRLIRPFLNHFLGKKSLGELLYNVSLERLGNWSEKEGKEEKFVEFKAAFPDSLSRELLLGKIAALIFNSNNGSITKEALFTIIKSEVKDGFQVISQACEYFINNVLQEEGDGYSFPSQPLYQCALGVFIVNEMIQKEKPSLKADLSSLWREFSFAAAIAKRKSIIDDIRPFLQEYITELLNNSGALAPIAIIIAESGDQQLAAFFINHLRNCGFRPIYYNPGFKSLSASSYALCIHLAQEDGFEWFYENYLNPNYPYPHTNDEIADSILQVWLLYRNFDVTTEQMINLRRIIEPSVVSKSWQCHSLLPTLSLVIPACFQDTQRLATLNAKKLASNLLRERAIYLLKELFNNGGKEEVLNALQITKNSTSAQLWLELCDETPPSSIIRTIIECWPKQKNLLEILRYRIGTDLLINILRWYALQQDKIAAYSALILHHFGECNLFFLGKGLLQGLHDGGKVQGTEEVVHELVKKYEKKGIEWIINQFPKADDLSGAHSAYWRILLEELNNSEDSFPNYLYFASRYLGEFILPRYPDIRRSLSKLLANKPEYREELYNKGLRSLDNKVRYNIACILLTCSPHSESEAADVVIRSALHGFERNEWHRFCMRLSLGQEVLNYIYIKTKQYLHVPKVFALMLLYHNNYKLSEEEFEYMVVGLLTSNASSFDLNDIRDNEDTTEKVLALPGAKDILVQQLENEDKQFVKESARALWDYHQEKLTTEQLITCWVHINVQMNYWSVSNIENSKDRFINNAELIEMVIRKIEKDINRETIVGQYLRSRSDESVWKDILWSCLFTTGNFDHQQIEYSFLWLLNKGIQNTSIGDIIGSASLEFLGHSSINAERMYNNAVPWLAFLAHEFGNLTNEKLEYIILNYEPIGQEIICALIARLGYVPKQYNSRKNRDFLLPELMKEKYSSLNYTEVVEITRDAEEIHENYINCLETVITKQVLNDRELEQIAAKSRFGGIFTSIIEFCCGNLKEYDSLIHSTSMDFTKFNKTNNEGARKVVNILRTIRSAISTDSKVNNKYFDLIESMIKTNDHDHILLLFEELFEYKRPITLTLLTIAVEELVSRPYELNMNLAVWFSNYFANNIKEEDKDFVVTELKKAILTLNSAVGKFPSIKTYISKWMFSLAVIYLEDDVDFETERLFLTALPSLFIEEEPIRINSDHRRQFKARDILNSVYPLLEKVPSDRLQSILQKGITSDVPEINSCCRILLALVGNRH